MDLLNEVIPLTNLADEAPMPTIDSQLSDFELCLVGGGMGDVQQ